MRNRSVAVIGGGPAGLYAARLIKLADPSTTVVVHERNRLDSETFGFGVGLTEATMTNLQAADPETAAEIRDVCYAGHNLVLREDADGTADVVLHGARNLAIGRAELLDVLGRAAERAGVDYRIGSRVDLADIDADVVIAADGVRSALRAKLSAELGVRESFGRGRYMWCGADFAVDAAHFTARAEGDGVFVAHAYPYSENRSTFLVEVDDTTWAAAGLNRFDAQVTPGESDTDSIALLQRLFADDLHGRPLLANRSRWARFCNLTLERWSSGNVVLIGDAAHTAHYTLGSGTKLAMEDAIALAAALSTHDDITAAFTAYERSRRPAVERFKALAGRSQRWWETYRLRAVQPAEQIALSYMTRAGNLSVADYARDHAQVVGAALRRLGSTPPAAADDLDDWILSRPLRRGALSLETRTVALEALTVALRRLIWSDPDVWGEAADGVVAGLAGSDPDTVVYLDGASDPAAVGARLDLAERIRLQHNLITVVSVPQESRGQAVAGIAAGRCDAVVLDRAAGKQVTR
ncbi:MAG TPA: FAD-dependent monooxygenase [Aldersonia sp.]